MKKVMFHRLFILAFSLVFILSGCGQPPASSTPSGDSKPAATSTPSTSDTAKTPASDFPNRPITIVHPYGTGGSADLLARTISENVQSLYPEFKFAVTSMPGGGTNIALNHLMTQPADGYTIMMNVEHSVLGTIMGTTDYSPEEYETILGLYQAPTMLYIRSNEDRFKSWEDIVSYTKANPDKKLVGAAGGVDGIYGIQIAELIGHYGLTSDNLMLSPYPESAERFAAFSGGHVDLLMQKADTVSKYVEAGEYVPVISFAPDRIDAYPDVPTAVELGAPESTSYLLPFGYIMKKGVPEDIASTIKKVFKEATETEEFQKFLKEQNTYEVKYGDDYHQDMLKRMEIYKPLAEKLFPDKMNQ
jgi:tripartite-type tricarboxylate transporter receptor subunit TctC